MKTNPSQEAQPSAPPRPEKIANLQLRAAAEITKQLAEINQRLERIEWHTSSTRTSTHYCAWFLFLLALPILLVIVGWVLFAVLAVGVT